MRIIGGKLRGTRLPPAGGAGVRPTTNRAKEALVNILNNYYDLDTVALLDLFAGTGNVGFEFASRGAEVTMVEKDRRLGRRLIQFARQHGLDNVDVWITSAERFVADAPDAYDLIFMDPPYDYPHYLRLIEQIVESGLVRPGGRLIVEHHHKFRLDGHPAFENARRYGQTVFSFLKPART